MTPSAISAAAEAYFNSNFSTTSIAWPNVSFTAPNGSWVAFHCLPDETVDGEIGDNGLIIRRGVLKIQIFTLPKAGTRAGSTIAGTIEALFTKTNISGVEFENPYTTNNGITQDKVWQQHTVTCPFWAWANE